MNMMQLSVPQEKIVCKKYKLFVRDNDGSIHEITPKDTFWYTLFIYTPQRKDRHRKQFCLRLYMPYDNFVTFSDGLNGHELFAQYSRPDAVRDGTPPRNDRLKKCLRLCMPYDNFVNLSDDLSGHESFAQYNCPYVFGDESSYI